MKKGLSLLLTIICLIIFIFPVSAFSTDGKSLNGVEISMLRFALRVQGKSNVEIADDLLKKLGVDENWIQIIPDEKKEEIAISSRIVEKTEYVRTDENGKEILITKGEYDLIEPVSNEISLNEGRSISTFAAGDKWEYPTDETENEEHSTFERHLYIYETKNAPVGTFGMILAYSWKNFGVAYRGTDVMSLSGESLVFNRSSFLFAAHYEYDEYYLFSTERGIEDYVVEEATLEDYDDLKGENNGISYKFGLPANFSYYDDSTGTLLSSKRYLVADYMMIVSAAADDWRENRWFNVYGNYFHQYMGILVTPEVTITGATVTVSPKLCYKDYLIQTEEQIVYS